MSMPTLTIILVHSSHMKGRLAKMRTRMGTTGSTDSRARGSPEPILGKFSEPILGNLPLASSTTGSGSRM